MLDPLRAIRACSDPMIVGLGITGYRVRDTHGCRNRGAQGCSSNGKKNPAIGTSGSGEDKKRKVRMEASRWEGRDGGEEGASSVHTGSPTFS